MNHKPKITVIGSLNMDLIVGAPHIPVPGETIIGGEFNTVAGGKGANQAVAAARLGGAVTMVGKVGDDAYGRAQIEGMQADGIDTTFISIDPHAHTGVALITVEESGQNSIVVSPGANWVLNAADVDAATEAIAGADMVLLQLETRLEVIERAVEIAAAHNVPVLLNPAPAHPLPSKVLEQITYFVPNESETAFYTGHPITDLDSAQKAAETLREMGVSVVILTLGSQGALLHAPAITRHVPACSVEVVDTTAAGDSFVGGFAVALASGMPLPEAVRFGGMAGALAVTKAGAQPSLPTRQAVELFIQEQCRSTHHPCCDNDG